MRHWSLHSVLIFCIGVIFAFQNCGQGFRVSEALSLRSQGISAHISHNAGATGRTNQPIHFEVGGAGLEGAQFQWFHTLGEVALGCDDEGNQDSSHYHVTCANEGMLSVTLEVFKNGEVTSTSVELNIQDGTTTPPTGDVVEFRIGSGTGMRSWNARGTPIKVYVGQTLKIINDDSVNHRLHTNGSPCPHTADITPGNSVNCVIASAYSSDPAPAGNGPLYDHNYQNENPRPDVWIYAFDGGTLYSTHCASCHGTLANSQKKGSTFEEIKGAIQNQSQMSGLRGVLSDDQIRAIAYSLKN